MFETIKSKVTNGEKCFDVLLNRTFGEIESNLNIHNIDIDKFAELVDRIEIKGDIESKNEYHARGFKGAMYYDIDFVLKDGKVLNYWYNNNLYMIRETFLDFDNRVIKHFESNIDSFNHIHEMLNDGIKEKYYETKWLKKSKKYNTMIENDLYRFAGFEERASYKGIVNNNNRLKFIDEKLGEIVDKLNLNKDECKNKFVMRNVGCFANSKDETIVVLNDGNNKLIVTFKYNENGIDVTYRDNEWNKL